MLRSTRSELQVLGAGGVREDEPATGESAAGRECRSCERAGSAVLWASSDAAALLPAADPSENHGQTPQALQVSLQEAAARLF